MEVTFSLLCRYIFTFAIGAGPVTGIVIPELSSSQMRGKIMGFSFAVHWVCALMYFLGDDAYFYFQNLLHVMLEKSWLIEHRTTCK